MLAWWFELMPLFVVKFFARRVCETVQVGNIAYLNARPDVIVKSKEQPLT